jgi:two-component sensor histidine kinase
MIQGPADHHIKNNLQRVASLLELQGTAETGMGHDEALAAAVARLKTLAHWHEFLARAQNSGRRTVALDGYLHAFADHFVDVFAARSWIVLLVNADPIRVPARVAGMLGQIVNELVINAARHAFGPKRPGTIQVECGTDAAGRIVLQVGDDGKGYANGYALPASGTLETQIVLALVKQLGGTFVAPKPGARGCHRITIPMPGRAPPESRKRQALRR